MKVLLGQSHFVFLFLTSAKSTINFLPVLLHVRAQRSNYYSLSRTTLSGQGLPALSKQLDLVT